MTKPETLMELGFTSEFIAAFKDYDEKIARIDIPLRVDDPLRFTTADSGSFVVKVNNSQQDGIVRIRHADFAAEQ